MANQLSSASVHRIVKVFNDHGFVDEAPLVKVVEFHHPLSGLTVYLNRESGADAEGRIRHIQIHTHPDSEFESFFDGIPAEIEPELRKHSGMRRFPRSGDESTFLSRAIVVESLDHLGQTLEALKGRSGSTGESEFVQPKWRIAELDEEQPSYSAGISGSTAAQVDYEKQARENKALGDAGELAALQREEKLLRDAGRDDLADRIVHVARVEGDGAGYDIRSFNPDGSQRWVEVKTTSGGAETDFFLTRNELAVCRGHPALYVLVRLWGFDSEAGTGKVFEIPGSRIQQLSMEPVIYRVSVLTEDVVDVPSER